MLSPDLQRILHILDYCNDVGGTIARFGNSYEVFQKDTDYQRSVAFSILQIGEISGGLSLEYRQSTADRIQWGPMKGMRNWVAHRYGEMSLETIWETAVIDIPVLKQFCEKELSQAE